MGSPIHANRVWISSKKLRIGRWQRTVDSTRTLLTGKTQKVANFQTLYVSTRLLTTVGYNGLHRPHDHVDVLGNAGRTTTSKPWRDPGNYRAGHWAGGVVPRQTRMTTHLHWQVLCLPGSWYKCKLRENGTRAAGSGDDDLVGGISKDKPDNTGGSRGQSGHAHSPFSHMQWSIIRSHSSLKQHVNMKYLSGNCAHNCQNAFSFRGLPPDQGLYPWTPLEAPPQSPVIKQSIFITPEGSTCRNTQ